MDGPPAFITGLVLLVCLASANQPPATSATDAVDVRPGVEVPQDRPARHAPTGLLFPAEFGRSLRLPPHVYDDAGRDVSAGYNLFPSFASVTIYIYPLPRDWDALEAFDHARVEISEAHPDWEIRTQGPRSAPHLGQPESEPTHCAVFASKGRDPAYGVPVESLLAVAKFSRPDSEGCSYAVKVRATYPAEMSQAAQRQVDKLLQHWRSENALNAPPATKPVTRPGPDLD